LKQNILTTFEKKYITSNIILYAAGFIYESIFNFYIWEKSKDFKLILIFNLIYFSTIFIGILFSEFILPRVHAKYVRALGIFFIIPFGLLIFSMNNISIPNIIILGILYGLGVGIRSQAYYVLYRNYIPVMNRANFEGTVKSLDNLNKIILPLLITQIISITQSYVISFVIGFILAFISIIPLLTIQVKDEYKSKVSFKESLEKIKDRAQIIKICSFKIFEGINSSITTAALGIITLYIIGGVGKWGIFNTIVIILGIVLATIVGRKLKLSSSPITFGFLAILFTIGSLIFANNFTFIGLVTFTLMKIPFDSLFSTSSSIITEKVIDINLIFDHFTDEIYVIYELFLMIGRTLPLLFMLILNANFENELILKSFIVILGLSTIMMFYIISGTNVAKRRNDPFLNA
jgi:MFS family permease